MKLKEIFENAKEFLLDKMDFEDRTKILDSYLKLEDTSDKPIPLQDIYKRLLVSAQNANMKATVIGQAIGGVDRLGEVLFDFDPKRVLEHYGENVDRILYDVESHLKPTGKIRKEENSIWPRYCKTIVSSAQFFSNFENGEDFYKWANIFYKDKVSMPALPFILSEEIYGIGYPLACDFIKEIGFIKYGKPDVHIRDILFGLGLVKSSPSDYQIQKILNEIAEESLVSVYEVDKLFWLIGSGYFYDHKNFGDNGRIGSLKEEYLRSVSILST